MQFNVAIIGAGLIGRKRAAAISKTGIGSLRAVVDINKDAAKKLATEFGGEAESDWRKVVTRKDINIVIVSTINSVLAPISIAALESGKHVLCEKPFGRNIKEAENILKAASKKNLVIKTGFNHRFHPAVWKAKQIVDEGIIGRLLIIRSRYGHGGRPGMEKEWRTSKELCGGGELLDQGVHVIDLIRWFGGEITEVYGKVETKFWDIEVEDNAFTILKTDKDVTASFHVSWTNWKNIFSFEIFGENGYLTINGLGGNYGPETLEIGKRQKEGGRPNIEVIDFPSDDISWEREWLEFVSAIKENRQPIGNGLDGLKANKVVEAIYKSSKLNRVIVIK